MVGSQPRAMSRPVAAWQNTAVQSPVAIDPQMIDAITRFIRSESEGDFNQLALAAGRAQASLSEPLQRLWADRDLDPGQVTSWSQIPALPTLAYKNLEIGIGSAETVFLSSGTSGRPSQHPHAFLDLYRATIEASFGARVPAGRVDILSLVPPPEAAPQSSLAFMVNHIMASYGSGRSAYGWSQNGLNAGLLRSWLGAGQRGGRPVVIVATSLALMQALERLAKFGLRFRLPPGSVVLHTGGSKTETRTLDRGEILALIATHLDLSEESVTSEYGMTELTSQFYSVPEDLVPADIVPEDLVPEDLVPADVVPEDLVPADARGQHPHADLPDSVLPDSELPDPELRSAELFAPPHWVRVRILDPATLQEVAPGTPGLITVLDLANLSSSIHVLTQDLGVMPTLQSEDSTGNGSPGFQLLGRAVGADLRGCSLLSGQLQPDQPSDAEG